MQRRYDNSGSNDAFSQSMWRVQPLPWPPPATDPTNARRLSASAHAVREPSLRSARPRARRWLSAARDARSFQPLRRLAPLRARNVFRRCRRAALPPAAAATAAAATRRLRVLPNCACERHACIPAVISTAATGQWTGRIRQVRL